MDAQAYEIGACDCREQEVGDGNVAGFFDYGHFKGVVADNRNRHDVTYLKFGQEGIGRIENI
jgi:hypothetical protein